LTVAATILDWSKQHNFLSYLCKVGESMR
jgi:hypothetical protein